MKDHKDTQKLMILRYLAQGYSITVAEALSKFGCYALSQRVGELKRDGWPIESHMVEVESGKRVARYSLPV